MTVFYCIQTYICYWISCFFLTFALENEKFGGVMGIYEELWVICFVATERSPFAFERLSTHNYS